MITNHVTRYLIPPRRRLSVSVENVIIAENQSAARGSTLGFISSAVMYFIVFLARD